MTELTDKQERFCQEYLLDLNGTQAAIRAGYSKRSARSIAEELLQKPHVRACILVLMAERQKRTGVDSDYVIATIVDTVERCRQATPVHDKAGNPLLIETPEGTLAQAYVFAPKSVLQGCSLLMEHLGMKKTRVEHSGPGGQPLAPPTIAISFPDGGPGVAAKETPSDSGVETS